MNAPGERCPACGNLRPTDTAVSGLCPLCLLRIGLEQEEQGQAGWIDPETWECRVLNLLDAEDGETSFLAEEVAPATRLVVLRQVHVQVDSADERALVTARLQSLTSFDHPHVARVLGGLVTSEGGLLLVTAYAPGTPLETFFERTQPAEQDRRSLLLAVAQAIEQAHERDLAHGALTPSRIVVTPPDPGVAWSCTYFRADDRFQIANLAEAPLGSACFEELRLRAIRRIDPRVECCNIICNRADANQWIHDSRA